MRPTEAARCHAPNGATVAATVPPWPQPPWPRLAGRPMGQAVIPSSSCYNCLTAATHESLRYSLCTLDSLHAALCTCSDRTTIEGGGRIGTLPASPWAAGGSVSSLHRPLRVEGGGRIGILPASPWAAGGSVSSLRRPLLVKRGGRIGILPASLGGGGRIGILPASPMGCGKPAQD